MTAEEAGREALGVTDGERPEVGLYLNCDERKYRSWDAVSSTLLKNGVSPRALGLYIADPNIINFTPAMRIGAAVDARWFGVDADRYVDQPENIDRRTKEGKAWAKENEGKVVLSRSEVEKIERTLEALNTHPVSAESLDLIRGGGDWVQPSAVAYVYGTLCKGRADMITRDHIIDLKTTGEKLRNQRDAERWVRRHQYHLQAALYMELFKVVCDLGGEPEGFAWIVAERDYPWEVSVWEASEMLMNEGRHLLSERMKTPTAPSGAL